LSIPILDVAKAVFPEKESAEASGGGSDSDGKDSSDSLSVPAQQAWKALEECGIRSAAILAAMTPEELSEVTGLSLGARKRLHAKAKQLVGADPNA